MRMIGEDCKDGTVRNFDPTKLYFGRDHLILECTSAVGNERCQYQTTQNVTNLKYWLEHPGHLRCQGILCLRDRTLIPRTARIRASLTQGWQISEVQAGTVPRWTVRHRCGYALTLTWPQFLKFHERVIDDKRCCICKRAIPTPLARTFDNMLLWFERHAPRLKLYRVLSHGHALILEVGCREHGGKWKVTTRQLMWSRSAGCRDCEKAMRHTKPNHWPESVSTLARHLRVGAPEGLPKSPDELVTWLPRNSPPERCTVRELVRRHFIPVPYASSFDAPADLTHYAFAGWMQADGYDLYGNRGRCALRAAITILACDLRILVRFARLVRCAQTLKFRFRRPDKPPGIYCVLTIVDDKFVGWLKDRFEFGPDKRTCGYPMGVTGSEQTTAYLAGLFGGDGYVEHPLRGPNIEWQVVDNRMLGEWIQAEVGGLILNDAGDPDAVEEFIRSGEQTIVRVYKDKRRRGAGRVATVYTIRVNQKFACSLLAKRLLTWEHYLPTRKVTRLHEIATLSPGLAKASRPHVMNESMARVHYVSAFATT